MRTLAVILAALFLAQLVPFPVLAQSDAGKAADCSTYARNRAESESSAGGGALRGGLRGGVGGALFGAIIDGGEGAKKGAALAGGIGLLRGGIRSSQDREARYQYYYDACMRGDVR